MVILDIKYFPKINHQLPLLHMKNHIIERIGKKRVENICSAERIEGGSENPK